MFNNFVPFLQNALQQSLPAEAAHRKMLSTQMSTRLLEPAADAKHSAVLIALYSVANQPVVLYIKRQDYPGVHSGQISFPGGKREPEDESLMHTALRESEEEIGLHSHNVEIIGQLSRLYIERSNYLVQPYVGIVHSLNHLIPHQREVQKIIHAPLSELHQSPIHHFTLNRKNASYQMPYYDLQGEVLWGATAMITAELLEISSPFFKK